MANTSNNTGKTAPLPAWMNYSINESERAAKKTGSKLATVVGGPFGTGKTYLLNTFPRGFWIDTDHGMATTKTTVDGATADGVRFFRGDKVFSTIMSLLNDAVNRRGKLDEYESILLDGWTSLSNLMYYEICGGLPDPKAGNKGGYDEYGSLRVRLNEIAAALRSIPYYVGSTVLTLIDKDEATGSYVGLFNTVGGFRDDLGDKFDEVYHMEKRRARSNEDGEVVYELFTQYHNRFDVKSRLQAAGKIPSKVANPTFTALYGDSYKEKKDTSNA